MSLRTAWESVNERHPCSFEEFAASAKGAQVIDIFYKGKDVGAFLILGPEIHACVKSEAHGAWFKRAGFAVIQQVIDRHGYAQTRMTAGNATGDKFVTRLGFVRVDSPPGTWIYRKE